jgi:dipeptidase
MVALKNTTQHNQTIFAKNSDRPADECQPLELHPRKTHPPGTQTQCQFVTLPEVETTYRHIGSRPYWCWGYEHGFNEHQVAIGNEAVHSHLPVSQTPKLIGMELLRLGLERGKTAAEAVSVMTDLISQYGQGKFENDANVRTYDNSYIVADPNEAYVIETAGHQWAVKQVEGALGISNVYSVETDWKYLSPEAQKKAPNHERLNFADTYTQNPRTEGSGATRRARSCSILSHLTGQINAQTMMNLLSDHGNAEASPNTFQTDLTQGGICVHCNEDGTGGNTAASLVADLCADGSRLPIYWCSLYSPCLGLFLPTFIEGELPTVLSIGSDTPTNESPWWHLHRLNQVTRTHPKDRIPLVRNKWQTLQAQLFETAYPIAQKAQQLINSGSDKEASQLLTNYMTKNTQTMLDTVTKLLRNFERQAA